MLRNSTRRRACLYVGLAIVLLLTGLTGCRMAPFDLDVTLNGIDGGGATVSYTALDADSGVPPVDSNNYLETATVTVQGPGTLVRAGYVLTGWTDGTNTYPATTGTFPMPAMNVTLDPVWTPAYTVTYTAIGADSGSPPADSTLYIAGATVTVLGNPGGLDQSAGTWTGWNDGSNTYLAGQTFVMPAGNVTLDPVFSPDPTYTVTYTGLNADGGSPPTDSNNYLETAIVTVQGAGSLIRSGYTLTGWTDGTNTYSPSTGTFAMPPGNVTLDPVWTAVYTVTYNANGGSSPPPPSAELPAGTNVTISGPGAMTNGSLTFTGWNTQADGLGTSYNPSDVVPMPVGGMLLYAQWDVIFAGGGSGTTMDPYVIMSPNDLNNVREDLAAHYRLSADIDMNVSPYNSGSGFEPIGNATTKFTGSFNGDTYTIHNLYMSRGVTGTGLFGRIEGASLTSIRLVNVNINNSANNTGAIVGNADGSGNTLTNSFVTGTIDSQGYNIGAVVGYAWEITVDNTFADATVSTNSIFLNGGVGGLIGRINSGGTIQQTYFRGSVTGTADNAVGGLIGASAADVMDSYVSATMVAPGTTRGGLVATGGGTVTDSFYDSDVALIPDNGYGVPRTTIEMQTLANFNGIWDFGSTWAMTDGSTYPYFQTQPSGIGSRPP